MVVGRMEWDVQKEILISKHEVLEGGKVIIFCLVSSNNTFYNILERVEEMNKYGVSIQK